MRHEDEGRAAETATDLFTYLKFMYFFFLFLFEVSIPNTKKKKKSEKWRDVFSPIVEK